MSTLREAIYNTIADVNRKSGWLVRILEGCVLVLYFRLLSSLLPRVRLFANRTDIGWLLMCSVQAAHVS